MIKKFTKGVFKKAGIDVRRFDVAAWNNYHRLFEKYRDFTMVPEDLFIMNLEICERFVNVQGDYVECGVWKGGMSAAISEILDPSRTVHLFDSFEGLPPAKEIDGPDALTWQANITSPTYYDNCSAPESFAVEAMRLAGRDNYRLYKGWFDKTTSGIQSPGIAVLRLDGDWYDSIITCLRNLYGKLSEGGVVILDDYYQWDGCSRAVHDFLSETRSPSRIFQWRDQIAYLVKKSG